LTERHLGESEHPVRHVGAGLHRALLGGKFISSDYLKLNGRR